MRIFETRVYNFKQIPFKDDKDYLDGLCRELGISYSDVCFAFTHDTSGAKCDKAVKLFPSLSGYKQLYSDTDPLGRTASEYLFSSVRFDGSGGYYPRMDRRDIPDVSALLRKIPRPVNFGFMGVVLDNVQWDDGQEDVSVFVPPKYQPTKPRHDFFGYYSNSIQFFKEFDYGTKRNPICLTLERFEESGGLSPYPDKYLAMAERLGKPDGKPHLACVFDEQDRLAQQKADAEIDAMRDRDRYAARFGDFLTKENPGGEIELSITPIEGFSPKDLLTGIAKPHRYRCNGTRAGQYQFQKKTVHNHVFTVEFLIRPFSHDVDASVWARGYNFHRPLQAFPGIVAKDEEDFRRYATLVFEAADEVETTFADKLVELYGLTPSWYA
ncbi:MAG: hypothetical protein ACOYJY_08145 [Acutalibacteraceae bacterium]|jgi:hypothetical protein